MERQTWLIQREPWNKGKLVGQKAPLKLKEIWSIRIRLELSHRIRDLALFNLAIDSKLRACDLVKLKVRDISHGNQITARAIVMQQKTGLPVHFEITEPTRNSIYAWLELAQLRSERFSISQPHSRLTTFIYQTICPYRRCLGRRNWFRFCKLWYTYDA